MVTLSGNFEESYLTPDLPQWEEPFFPWVRVNVRENMIREAETQVHRRIREKDHLQQGHLTLPLL